MRRQLEIFVPIVLLSILVQLFAPIAAFRVVANAVSDPLYMSSICSGVASSTDGSQTSPGNTHHDGANRCTFCVVGWGGVVALAFNAGGFISEIVRAGLQSKTPMRRNGTPDDIARAALFFAAPASSWITGKLLEVDGAAPAGLFPNESPDL